jgi:hypothetical protein
MVRTHALLKQAPSAPARAAPNGVSVAGAVLKLMIQFFCLRACGELEVRQKQDGESQARVERELSENSQNQAGPARPGYLFRR